MIESMESSNKLNSDALNVLQQTVNEVVCACVYHVIFDHLLI
jgi:hypothetical protein